MQVIKKGGPAAEGEALRIVRAEELAERPSADAVHGAGAARREKEGGRRREGGGGGGVCRKQEPHLGCGE